MQPHQWYFDYFAINQYAFAQVYFGVHDFTRERAYYQVSLAKRASSRMNIGNFPIIDATTGVATIVYAVKSVDSAFERQPSQEVYRSAEERLKVEQSFFSFATYECEPLIRSSRPSPIVMPGGDDFQYIDIDGGLVTESNRNNHYSQLRTNMISAMQHMDRMNGETRWGILELEKPFYDVVVESAEARAIIAKSNVILFDARMLNQCATVDGIRKEIYPAATALMLDIPILVFSTEPEDALWKRASRYFLHTRLYAACHGDAANYYFAGVTVSPSLENSDYQGSPSKCIGKVHKLIVSGSPPPPCNARATRHDAAHIRDVESHLWSTIWLKLRDRVAGSISRSGRGVGVAGAMKPRAGSWRNPMRRARWCRRWRAGTTSRRSICSLGARRHAAVC